MMQPDRVAIRVLNSGEVADKAFTGGYSDGHALDFKFLGCFLNTQAIREYEAQQDEAARPAIRDYVAAMAGWEARQAGVKQKIKADAKAVW